MLNTAVLIMAFNRPETTRKVFEAVRKAKPKKLYVSTDGPRNDNEQDQNKTKKVKEILSKVDWDCAVYTRFREVNLGCMVACTDAMTWFFENEEMGIILEDDCLPSQSFFHYCEAVLNKYKDDTRVVHVNGNNYNSPKVTETSYSYHFTFFPQVWGWATWRRAWNKFSTKMIYFDDFDDARYFRHVGLTEKDYQKIRKRWMKVHKEGADNIWDYQWHFMNMLEGNLVVSPVKNLISNLGFNRDSTHSPNVNILKANLPIHELDLPIKHPPCLFVDPLLNDYYKNMMINESFFIKVKRKLLDRGINV